jgi:hypothetical protein
MGGQQIAGISNAATAAAVNEASVRVMMQRINVLESQVQVNGLSSIGLNRHYVPMRFCSAHDHPPRILSMDILSMDIRSMDAYCFFVDLELSVLSDCCRK